MSERKEDMDFPPEETPFRERPTHTPRGHKILSMEEAAQTEFPFMSESDLCKEKPAPVMSPTLVTQEEFCSEDYNTDFSRDQFLCRINKTISE